MKDSVSPVLAAFLIAALLAVIGFMGYRYFSPANQESKSLNSHVDLSNIKPGDFDAVRKEIEAARESRGGTAR